MRTALRFELLRRMVGALRGAWVVSDPGWVERLQTQMADRADEARVEAARRRAAAQARLAEHGGKAVYVGDLRVRVAGRGIKLDEHPQRPDLEVWLVDELGLDDYAGDHARVRITVELLDGEGASS